MPGERSPDDSKKPLVGSTTSLGKRRSLRRSRQRDRRAGNQNKTNQSRNRTEQEQNGQQHLDDNQSMSSVKSADYGSQASPIRAAKAAERAENNKVTILGAAGGIGQPLALLLMLHSEYVQHLALHDLAVQVRGVGLDLSHIDRQCTITTHLGPEELADAVRGAKVIIIPAGLAQKPGMSRDDLFGSNAKIVFNLAKVCAQVAPQASIALITNPVNSLVPLVCEVYASLLKSESPQQVELAQRRIFGVTTLDVVRASSLTARSGLVDKPAPASAQAATGQQQQQQQPAAGMFGRDPAKVSVPVVGGHAGKTILPLLSQASPKIDRKRLIRETAAGEQKASIDAQVLIENVQQAGIDVLNSKKGSGSATLAMAYAACRFTISLLRAQLGEQNIVECAYVKHQKQQQQQLQSSPGNILPNDLEYFASPLLLGKDGGYVKPILFCQKLLTFEQQMLDEAAKELRTSVAKGEDFAKERLREIVLR